MTVFVYSVDRTESRALRWQAGELSPSQETKWHRAKPDDEGLALCSRRIVLNTEDKALPTAPFVGDLCQRCFKPTDSGVEQ